MSLDTLFPYSEVAASIVIGAIYQHYKKLDYKVLAIGRHSETLEEMVVYQALYGDKNIWIRPVSMFVENIVLDGKTYPRFALCQD